MPNESNEGKYFNQFTPFVNIFILFYFFLDNNSIILSNHPNKEDISEFIIKCTSTAEENLLPNLFDWKSNSSWISEDPRGIVRTQNIIFFLTNYIVIILFIALD